MIGAGIHGLSTGLHLARMLKAIPMWRYWQLEEGVLDVDPGFLTTNDGGMPPVMHVDTDAPLRSDATGKIISEELWGVYYKPDFSFGGIQGGAMPYRIDTPAETVPVDPYGPESPTFVASQEFADMWTSALAFCHGRFVGRSGRYRQEKSGGIGCFTPDSFPVFDRFRDNAVAWHLNARMRWFCREWEKGGGQAARANLACLRRPSATAARTCNTR